MVFIIVPVYNEDSRQVRNTVISLLSLGYQVVLVNDGWKKSFKDDLNDLNIHYLRHAINLGQGAALQTGVEYALIQRAQYIVHFDADGQHDPEAVEKLLAPIRRKELDVVLGSRFLEQSNSNKVPFLRKIILQFARYINWSFTGLLLSDAHNGLRAMNKEAAERIFLRENRSAHATEILSEIRKNGLRFKEVSVSITYSNYSQKKGQKSSNVFEIFLDLISNKIFR